MQNLSIPGNEPLCRRISEAARSGSLSLAIILSGSGDLAAAARYVAAAMQCTGDAPPCGMCAACGKVSRDIHPDVTVVTDEEHKNISIDILREVRTDAYTLPNEGHRKIYIFPDCERLEPKTQNVLLKVLEEGPPHAAFLFCAANSAVLLPTIRSRAVEWKLAPTAHRGELSDRAQELCLLISERRTAELVTLLTGWENSKMTREELQKILSDARDIFTASLAATYHAGSGDPLAARLGREMGRRRLTAAIDILQKFIRDCGFNISVGHLTGALSAALDI